MIVLGAGFCFCAVLVLVFALLYWMCPCVKVLFGIVFYVFVIALFYLYS